MPSLSAGSARLQTPINWPSASANHRFAGDFDVGRPLVLVQAGDLAVMSARISAAIATDTEDAVPIADLVARRSHQNWLDRHARADHHQSDVVGQVVIQ